MSVQPEPQPRPSDKYIPWLFAAFFVVMVAVLIPMTIIAVRTMPGTVTEDSYGKGLAYNKWIAAGEAEASLGWKGSIAVSFGADKKADISYLLTDAQKKPVAGAKTHVWLVRPVQNGLDRDFDMAESAAGRYEATVALPAPGVWDVRISATKDGQNYQTTKRIVTP